MRLKVGLVAVALLAGFLVMPDPASAATTTLKVQCSGSDAASQGSLAIVGGTINADVVVNHSAPELLEPGDSASVDFSFTTQISPDLIDKAVSLLGVSSVGVVGLKFNVSASGAGVNQSVDAGPFDTSVPVSVGSGLSLSNGPFNLSYSNVTSGVVSYRFAPVKMTVAIGAISVNVSCSPVGSNVLAKTLVRDPDAPIAGNKTITVRPGESFSTDLSELVTPGPTPVIPDSYKLVEGNGSLSGTVLNGVGTGEAGTTTYTYEVCAEPKADGGTPGVNEKVSLGFSAIDQNERPVAFSLKVGDVETPLVWTTQAKPAFEFLGMWLQPPLPASNGSQGKTNMEDWGEYLLLSDFKAPTATDILNALTAAGFEATVTGMFPNFNIEFVGKDGEKDVADVKIGKWLTVLPYEFFLQIKDIVAGMSANSGGPAPVLLTDEEINTLILQGRIDEAGEAFKNRLLNGLKDAAPQLLDSLVNSFAQPPVIESVNGEKSAAAQSMCSQGQVDVVVTSEVATTSTTATPISGPAVEASPATGVTEDARISFTG